MKKSPLVSIFLIIVVDILGLTIILPLLPFYAEKLGASPVMVGILISTYGFCQLIAGPILGQISDRVGRKPLLLVSQMGTFVGFVLLALSRNLVLVFLARIIDGLTAGNLSVAQAYISDVTDHENRAKSFGIIGIAFGLGFLIGPAISGFLAQFGYHYPIVAAATLSATSIAATYFLLPSTPIHVPTSDETSERKNPFWQINWDSFKDPELAPLLWQFLAFIFAFAIFISGFALFAERRLTHGGIFFGPKEVGYVFAYIGLVGVFIQGVMIGPLVKKFGEARLVKFGFINMLVGFILLGWVWNVPILLIALTIAFLGSSLLRPSLTSLVTKKAGKAQQGMMLGLTQSLTSIAQIIAPLVSGVLIQHRFLSFWAWVSALSSAVGLWLIERYKFLPSKV